MLKYLVQNLQFENKETEMIIVGETWGYICACMCVYDGVNWGTLRWE